MAKLTLAAVHSLFNDQTKTFMDEINALKEEVASLKAEVAATREFMGSCTTGETLADSTQSVTDASTKTFADALKNSMHSVVTNTVQSALREQQVRNDVVINKLPEKNNDVNDVDQLCSTIEVKVKPTNILRLGKNDAHRPRPLKATFPNPFDARIFMAKIDESKKKGIESVAQLKCRPGRTREEQAKYSTIAKTVHKLNQDAKAEGVVSYSLRRNGEIWKFTKTDNGSWRRVSDWTYSPPHVDAGAETGTDSDSESNLDQEN